MRCKVFIVLLVATVLTVYGIETILNLSDKLTRLIGVATVLTVYGIETYRSWASSTHQLVFCCNSTYRLRYWNSIRSLWIYPSVGRCNSTYRLRYWNWHTLALDALVLSLQQYLSFMVLKSSICNYTHILFTLVAIVLTIYGIETAFRSRELLASLSAVAIVFIVTICVYYRWWGRSGTAQRWNLPYCSYLYRLKVNKGDKGLHYIFISNRKRVNFLIHSFF